MIRILIFMGLIAMSMLTASCCLIMACSCSKVIKPLEQATREDLELVKKEVSVTINLTNEEVKRNEVDSHVGNEIYDSLALTIKQLDTLIATSFKLERTGTKEEVLKFAYEANQVVENTLDNLKSLRDLYDISTYSQFEIATFFPVDSFNIPPEKIAEAKKAIEPVAQRIVRFFAEHPGQKFKAVIACSSTPDCQDLTDKLCKLKARSIARLLVDQIKSKEEFIPNPALIRYYIKWVDQREALSYPGKRRSMVSLTWNMLPASLYAGPSYH